MSAKSDDERRRHFSVQIGKTRDGRRFIARRVRPSRSSPTNCEIVTTTLTTTTTSAGNFWGTDYLFSRGKVLRPDPEYYRLSGPLSDEPARCERTLVFGSVPQIPSLSRTGRLPSSLGPLAVVKLGGQTDIRRRACPLSPRRRRGSVRGEGRRRKRLMAGLRGSSRIAGAGEGGSRFTFVDGIRPRAGGWQRPSALDQLS